MAGKPQLHSVWRDSAGERFIVTAIDDDEPDFWLATLVPYAQRFDTAAMGVELDSDEWADLLAKDDGFAQIGFEPGEYPI